MIVTASASICVMQQLSLNFFIHGLGRGRLVEASASVPFIALTLSICRQERYPVCKLSAVTRLIQRRLNLLDCLTSEIG